MLGLFDIRSLILFHRILQPRAINDIFMAFWLKLYGKQE